MTMAFTIGSDFEMMGVDAHGLLHSFEGLIGGSKREPLYVDEEGNNVQEDNVLAEAATKVCRSKQEFMSAVIGMSGLLHEVAARHNIKIVASCSGEYPAEQLETQQARTFGCDTSYNAYSMMEEKVPRNVGRWRSAGGHVHVGMGEHAENYELMFTLIKNMDAFIGVPLMLHAGREQRAQEVQRRRMYGAAGSMRMKEYGVEYRALSNYWTFEEQLISFVYDAVERAVAFTLEGGEIDPQYTVAVLNEGEQADLNYFYNLPNWEEVE